MRLIVPVKTLLVDLDGTLVANRALPLSVDFVTQSMKAMRKFGGWKLAVRTLAAINSELHGRGRRAPRDPARDPAAERRRPDSNDQRVVRLFAERMGMDETKARETLREQLFLIFPMLQRHFSPIPGAVEFLKWAHGRYPLVLATNPVWPVEVIEMRVRWAGLDPALFKSITHIRKMSACKPEPTYYEEILDQEGLLPEHCLLVGNDRKMDLPATRVGIRVFIVGPYRRLTELRHPMGRAPGYRGSFEHLRALLETDPSRPVG